MIVSQNLGDPPFRSLLSFSFRTQNIESPFFSDIWGLSWTLCILIVFKHFFPGIYFFFSSKESYCFCKSLIGKHAQKRNKNLLVWDRTEWREVYIGMQTSSGCSRKLDFFLEILKTANLVQCPQVEEQRVCETCGRANIIFDGSSLLISLPTHLVPSTRMCVIDTEREGEKRESRSRRREAVHESIDLAILERLQPYTSLGYPSIPFSFSSNNSGAFSLKKFMYLWQRVSYCFFLGDVICSD